MKNVEHINIVVQNSCPANIFRLKIRNIKKIIFLKNFFKIIKLFYSKKKKKKKKLLRKCESTINNFNIFA
jgi:hypothetical protein